MTSETFHFKRGANQQFCQMTHVFDPSRYSEDELLYDMDREIIPIAIHCVAEEGPEGRYKRVLYLEKGTDLCFVVQPRYATVTYDHCDGGEMCGGHIPVKGIKTETVR